jgi:cytoskeletal protein RodZ
VSAIVFVIRAMSRNPELSLVPTTKQDGEGRDVADGAGEDEDNELEQEVGEGEESEGEDEEDIAPVDSLSTGSDDDLGQVEPSGTQSTPEKSTTKAAVKAPTVTPTSTAGSSSKKREKRGESADEAVEGEEKGEEGDSTDGCRWVMQRLKGLGSDPRGRKRLHVIRVSDPLALRSSSL